MLRLSRPLPPRQREGTIALINVVFLMLIFFLIAGTLAPPMEAEIRLIETVMAEQTELPHALFVTSEGELREGGRTVDPASYVASLNAQGGEAEGIEVKLAADRELPAVRLIDIVRALRESGADKVSIITERSTE